LISYIHYGLNSTTEVWVMNADGTNKSQIVPTNLTRLQSPDFSPDGKLLTVIGQVTGSTGTSKDLFSVPAPTAPLTAPTTTTLPATRLTTSGVLSADWQAISITVFPLRVSNISLRGGEGVVTSQPSGINCGTQCTTDMVADTLVTLTATAKPGSKFANWSGACTGKKPTCVVLVNQQRSVVAYFKK
jgi:hypothetical protein